MAENILTNSYIHNTFAKPLENYAVGRLLDDITKRFPNKEAFVFMKDNTRKTFQELHRDVNQIAAGFLQFGLKPGDRVGIWADESYDWVKTDLAIATAGMITVRLPLLSSPQRLLQLLDTLSCTALVIGDQQKDPVKTIKEVLPSINMSTGHRLSLKELMNLKYIISISPTQDSFIINYGDITNLGNEDVAKAELDRVKLNQNLDDVYAVVFSSGSTGLPKAVAVPNRRFNNTRNLMEFIHGITTETIKTEELIFPRVNPCTSAAYTIAEGLMLVLGCTTVFPYPPQGTESMLDAIQKERCNMAFLFPMHVNDILSYPDTETLGLKSLKYAMVGGNITPPITMMKLSTLLATEVQTLYGSIEGGILASHNYKEPLEDKVSNVGIPVYHGEIRISDVKSGRIVPIGKIGEVWFRGNTTFTCYWGDEKKTREALIQNGWFCTGDLGKMNKYGQLEIIGRKDDMIIKGAINVYRAEIENALSGHPKIKAHKVVPVPDTRFINELCLCVILQDGQTATEDELKDYLKDKIDEYFIPRYVLFMESMPVTETAKVIRNDLAILSAEILHLAK
ncbi:medium-chain acyl-CoA ligase ACSF2, mitochondrial-like [Glandiceps talaboti]